MRSGAIFPEPLLALQAIGIGREECLEELISYTQEKNSISDCPAERGLESCLTP